MAHEFNIKNGFITSGQSYVYNNLIVTGLTLSSIPANDDTLTQILARDSSGNVKYRNASSLGGGSSTFTGGTVSGATIFTGGLSANTISATTYQGNIVTSISAGNNINVSQATGDVTVTAVPSNNTTAIQFNDSGSFAGDDTTLAYILTQGVFVGGSASYTVGGSVTKSSIIGGESNSLSDNINRSVIIGGRSSLIRGNSISSVIIGGDTNEINNFNNTIILGGSNITATASDFVYVPSLNINTIPTNDDSLTQVLVRDSGTGDVKYRTASTIGGGGTFTGGTVSGGTNFIGGVTANTLVYSVVTLTYASTIAVNATLGNEFKVTLTGNAVLGNPTGALDGQYLRFAIRQDATGARNLTFDTKYRFGNEIGTPSVDLTANKTSYLGVRYNAQDDDFDVISFVSGY